MTKERGGDDGMREAEQKLYLRHTRLINESPSLRRLTEFHCKALTRSKAAFAHFDVFVCRPQLKLPNVYTYTYIRMCIRAC